MGQSVVLAYSGGLDTSAIVPWLKQNYGYDVICYAANVGQGDSELAGLEEKARASGAVDCVIDDLREQFVRDIIFPTVKSGAIYAREYLLGTAMARPVIAAGQAALALRIGASALAHGCTGKGNDQVRFELTYMSHAPDLKVIAPWREWEFRGREDLFDYLQRLGMPSDSVRDKVYSRDRNLWHCSHEGGVLEDPGAAPVAEMFLLTNDPTEAPDKPADVVIDFEQGEPVAVNGIPLNPVELVEYLNGIAGEHGVGRADIVEDRLVGMKSRGVYETPAGTVLRTAHRELEQLVLDRRTVALKDAVAFRYADLLYEGRWWSDEREAIDALVSVTQRRVNGSVGLRLYKGSITVQSRRSPDALYSPEHATFEADEVYNQADAAGFIRLFGLSSRLASRRGSGAAQRTT